MPKLWIVFLLLAGLDWCQLRMLIILGLMSQSPSLFGLRHLPHRPTNPI